MIKIKNICKILPYLVANVMIFYLLPMAITDTGIAMLVMLVGIPALCFATAIVYGVKNQFQRIYPVLVAILFVPSIFLFYNDTAWPYAIVYGMLALAGGLVGKIFHKPAK